MPAGALLARNIMHQVMLTVDVEAFPRRATHDRPVDQLIWGLFPDGEFGICPMMDVAAKHGAPLVMFVDYAETRMHGPSFLDVPREIARRGHEIQMHLHIDSFTADFLRKHNIPLTATPNDLTDEQAKLIFDEVDALHAKVTDQPFRAFRGGGYRYGAAILNTIHDAGIAISSNYNQAVKFQPYNFGPRKQFKWSNGVLELPISTLSGFKGSNYTAHFNFNIGAFADPPLEQGVANSVEFLGQHYRERGDDALAVFVLHSWSFLKLDKAGKFSTPHPDSAERLSAMLDAWRAKLNVEFIGTKQAVERFSAVETLPINRAVINPSGLNSTACYICGSTEFKDYNGPKRLCKTCSSTERQRLFAEAYDTHIKDAFDISKKEVLVVAPIAAERRMFNDRRITKFKTLDIRPQFKADFPCDICKMDGVADASFDAVFASYVLPCVHDLDAALSEIRRVLKPGGMFLTCDPVSLTANTTEITDIDKIASWYGRELYEQFKIGHFRSFGDMDYVAKLSEYFTVKTFPSVDGPTGSKNWIVAACKKMPKQ
jgi:SAM-dependent methyltransferase